jgi:hypothetical protein
MEHFDVEYGLQWIHSSNNLDFMHTNKGGQICSRLMFTPNKRRQSCLRKENKKLMAFAETSEPN